MEAAREGTPQNVSFGAPFQTDERVQSVKKEFLIKRGGNTMNREETISGDDDVPYWSEEDTKWRGCAK